MLPPEDLLAPGYCFAEFSGETVDAAVAAAVAWHRDGRGYADHLPLPKGVVLELLLHPADRVHGWVVVDPVDLLG